MNSRICHITVKIWTLIVEVEMKRHNSSSNGLNIIWKKLWDFSLSKLQVGNFTTTLQSPLMCLLPYEDRSDQCGSLPTPRGRFLVTTHRLHCLHLTCILSSLMTTRNAFLEVLYTIETSLFFPNATLTTVWRRQGTWPQLHVLSTHQDHMKQLSIWDLLRQSNNIQPPETRHFKYADDMAVVAHLSNMKSFFRELCIKTVMVKMFFYIEVF